MSSIKLFFLTFILLNLLTFTTTFAEINAKKWDVQCEDKKKKINCVIGITKEIQLKNSSTKQVIATAYIRPASSIENQLQLVNEDEKTYKSVKVTKNHSLFIVNLPLNVDLRNKNKPIISIDNKFIAKTDFYHCNGEIGCKTMLLLTDEMLDFYKKGKVLSIYFQVYGNKEKSMIGFPLKGFTKAYKNRTF